MFSFFKKKEEKKVSIDLKAFLTGQAISLEEVGDGVFSSKCLGEGMAIIPEDEVLVAPADGEILVVMEDSFHAVAMRLTNGMEILLHIGLDTVEMKGEGFCPKVKPGDHVTCGTELIQFSKAAIAKAGYRDVTILVCTNGSEYPNVSFMSGMKVYASKTQIGEV